MLLFRACSHPWGKAYPKKEVLPTILPLRLPSPCGLLRTLPAVHPGIQILFLDTLRMSVDRWTVLVFLSSPGPLSSAPPALLWESMEKQTPPAALPLNRVWGLIKVHGCARARHWHLFLNMHFWALSVGYLIPVDRSVPGNTTRVPVNLSLCVFHQGLCCADTSDRAVLRGQMILGWKP